MTESIRKRVFICSAFLIPFLLGCAAYLRPEYFTNETYLGGLIVLGLLMASVWMYRRVFFPVVVMSFLFAGVNIPVGSFWTSGRWLILGTGALVGCLIVLKERGYPFKTFHALALFAVLTGLVSATVSRYTTVALLKTLSVFLLFLYASTGVRVAVNGREHRFFAGLLVGSQIFFVVLAVFYAAGIEVLGNPNSLGAVAGVVGVPTLLWGTMLAPKPTVRHWRLGLYLICMFMTFASHARAGIAAALISSGLMCLALRKYRAMIQGGVVIVTLVAASSLFWPSVVPSLTFDILYKGGQLEQGILASRESPWKAALDRINDHPWFGTGLGTTVEGGRLSEEQGLFASHSSVTAETGSSYFSLLTGVGVFGAVPFALLLFMLIGSTVRTMIWMRNFRSASHPAVPVAMVVVAGIFHAGFEDWMFAPGSYLCVFFWSLAFILIDMAPATRIQDLPRWCPDAMQQSASTVARSM